MFKLGVDKNENPNTKNTKHMKLQFDINYTNHCIPDGRFYHESAMISEGFTSSQSKK